MIKVLPTIAFAYLVLALPHGILETLSLIGVLVTAGIAIKQTFSPKVDEPQGYEQ